MKVYLDGKFVDSADAKVSVFDHGLLYGDGVFEGIRLYSGNIFRLEEHLERLRAPRDELHRQVRDPRERGRRWRELVAGWNFHGVNDLIEKHNRWYPVEARLAMNPRTGDFVLVGGKPYRREPLDAAWALRRFPPDDSDRLAA